MQLTVKGVLENERLRGSPSRGRRLSFSMMERSKMKRVYTNRDTPIDYIQTVSVIKNASFMYRDSCQIGRDVDSPLYS
jgi:hypothetical protein